MTPAETPTPTETLRRAADVLERRAAALPDDYRGTWQTHTMWVSTPRGGMHPTEHYETGVFTEFPVDDVDTDSGSTAWHGVVAEVERPEVRAWIATMSPAVAVPLVAWLRTATDDYRVDGDTYWNQALDFARAVLTAAGEET